MEYAKSKHIISVINVVLQQLHVYTKLLSTIEVAPKCNMLLYNMTTS